MPSSDQAAAAAAAVLRELRAAAGLSQAMLSARSGVSERTIRALENGRIRAPQPATVRALAAPLGLRGAQVETLANAWRPARHTPLELAELLDRPDLSFELSDALTEQPRRIREITRVYRTRIDEFGLLARVHVARTFEVLAADGLDRLVWAQGYDARSLDPALVEVTGTVNCRAGRNIVVEAGMQAHELLLEQTLAPGSRYALAYAADFRAAYRNGDRPARELESLTGWHSVGGAMSSVEVEFDPRCLPASIWAVAQRTVSRDGPPPKRMLELNPFHIAQDIVEQPAPGTHGLRWSWDCAPSVQGGEDAGGRAGVDLSTGELEQPRPAAP